MQHSCLRLMGRRKATPADLSQLGYDRSPIPPSPLSRVPDLFPRMRSGQRVAAVLGTALSIVAVGAVTMVRTPAAESFSKKAAPWCCRPRRVSRPFAAESGVSLEAKPLAAACCQRWARGGPASAAERLRLCCGRIHATHAPRVPRAAPRSPNGTGSTQTTARPGQMSRRGSRGPATRCGVG